MIIMKKDKSEEIELLEDDNQENNKEKNIKSDVKNKKQKKKNAKKVKEEKPNSKKIKKKVHIRWTKKLTIITIAILLIIALIATLYFILFPHIKLKGDKKMVINYKTVYKENGYSAYKLSDDLTKDVKVSGKVNSNKLGQYKIVYKVGNGFFKTKKTRTVVVDDIEKPKLSIKNDDAYVCPGKKYQKEEVKATDNYDGDLTKNIKVDITNKKVTYSVKDKAGNTKTVTKKIVYGDIEKPTIILEGPENYDMCTNEVYKDPGYTATDNCDGDLSSKVQVEGNVDNSIEGEFELKYKVKDKAGNEAEATRKVTVGKSDAPGVVYLTFDDGPSDGTTGTILDILKDEGVEATFFVSNANGGSDEMIKREHDEGHTVALHTASHEYSILYASDEAYFADLQEVHDRVQRITGVDSKIIRFPGGSSNTVSRHYSQGIMSRLTQEVVNRGYKYYDWNISSGDAEAGNKDASKIYNNVISQLSKNRVNMVLMHDIKPYTRDALRDIIRYCKDNGYTLKKITPCTEMVTQRVGN